MKNYQTVLINRLAHQVKNDLTTMRLALFNLNYLLDKEEVNQIHKKSNDFLQAVQTSLDHSIETLSRILLATRTDRKYFKSENLMRILFDVITQSPLHDIFKIKILKQEIRISTDAQSLQLFFKLLLASLKNSLKTKNSHIQIQLSQKNDHCIVFVGNFHGSKLTDLVNVTENSLPDNTDPVTFLLIKQMMDYLHISLKLVEIGNGASEVNVCFNQKNKEKQ